MRQHESKSCEMPGTLPSVGLKALLLFLILDLPSSASTHEVLALIPLPSFGPVKILPSYHKRLGINSLLDKGHASRQCFSIEVGVLRVFFFSQ